MALLALATTHEYVRRAGVLSLQATTSDKYVCNETCRPYSASAQGPGPEFVWPEFLLIRPQSNPRQLLIAPKTIPRSLLEMPVVLMGQKLMGSNIQGYSM